MELLKQILWVVCAFAIAILIFIGVVLPLFEFMKHIYLKGFTF